MEVNKLVDYICVYDNIFGDTKNLSLNKLLQQEYFPFEEAKIYDKKNNIILNKDIRSTELFNFSNINTDNKTFIHWTNLFMSCIEYHIKIYSEMTNTQSMCQIQDLQLLKYQKGGFYKQHVDHGSKSPRTLSFIYFVNDDYEGGELFFELPKIKESYKVGVKKDRLIIWPSNFLYPHKVEPVTKGIKYSVVSWAL